MRLYCRDCKKKTEQTLNYEIPFKRQEWMCDCGCLTHLITKAFVYHEPSEIPDWVKKAFPKLEEATPFKKGRRIGRYIFKRLSKKAYKDNNNIQWYYTKSTVHKVKRKRRERAQTYNPFKDLKGILRKLGKPSDIIEIETKEFYLYRLSVFNGIWIPKALLRQIKSVLNQRGYGASLPDRIKHTEKEINTLKKLLVLFNYNKTLMSRFLYRYYWKHFKNEESVRKYLEEYGIKKPWYNTKLTKKQRESCQKIFYEHYIMESIDDLGEYFRKNQTDKTIQDITVRWILAKPEKIQDLVDKLAHTK